jgi:hypothetical protein
MENNVRREDLINFLLALKNSLSNSKQKEHVEACNQIPIIINLIKSHDVNFDDYVAMDIKKKTKFHNTTLLRWVLEILKVIYDFFNSNNSGF